MRLLLTAFGLTLVDLYVLERDDPEPPGLTGDTVAVSGTTDASARLGFIDDVGVGSTWPWE